MKIKYFNNYIQEMLSCQIFMICISRNNFKQFFMYIIAVAQSLFSKMSKFDVELKTS